MRGYAFEEGRPPLINLYRDTERGLFLGVCAGIADRFGWDLTAVRIIAALFALFATAPTVLLYVVLGLVTAPKRLTYYGDREDRLWKRTRRRGSRSIG